MSEEIRKMQSGRVYQALLAFLAIVSFLLLAYEIFGDPVPKEVEIMIGIDMVVAFLFLADFFVGLLVSKKKKRYLKENWLNFISSIPISDSTFRALRLLRLIRALRVIRAARVASAVAGLGQAIGFISKDKRNS